MDNVGLLPRSVILRRCAKNATAVAMMSSWNDVWKFAPICELHGPSNHCKHPREETESDPVADRDIDEERASHQAASHEAA